MELRELNENDGKNIWDMLKEIPASENGYTNNAYSLSLEEFPQFLRRQCEISKGIDLDADYVPQTTYWFLVNDNPVGIGKLRHYLNDKLKAYGGHIGYAIRPSERGKGYGSVLLKELLGEARKKGILELVLMCNEDNTASRKVIEANSGKLASIVDSHCIYHIVLR